MNKKIITATIVILLIIVAAVAFVYFSSSTGAVQSQTIPTVSVDPVSTTVQNAKIGQTIQVTLNITDVKNLWGWELDNLTYNPQVLNLTQVSEGPFLKSGGPTFFISTNGVPETYRGDLINTMAAINENKTAQGSGVLVTLKFTVIAAGTSPITINGPNPVSGTSAVILYNPMEIQSNSNAESGIHQNINCTPVNGQVTIVNVIP